MLLVHVLDPAFLVAGVLGLFFFLASLISGLRATGGFKPSLNLAGGSSFPLPDIEKKRR